MLRHLAVCSHDVLLACHLAGLSRCQSRKLRRIDIGCPVERACTETWEGLLLDRLRIDEVSNTEASILLLQFIRNSLEVQDHLRRHNLRHRIITRKLDLFLRGILADRFLISSLLLLPSRFLVNAESFIVLIILLIKFEQVFLG